jgi:ADP-ribosylglycohydrolase
MPGFDTDCNGATAGSVWGIVNGVDAIPEYWSGLFSDTMQSHLLHWRELKISDLASQMATLADDLRK